MSPRLGRGQVIRPAVPAAEGGGGGGGGGGDGVTNYATQTSGGIQVIGDVGLSPALDMDGTITHDPDGYFAADRIVIPAGLAGVYVYEARVTLAAGAGNGYLAVTTTALDISERTAFGDLAIQYVLINGGPRWMDEGDELWLQVYHDDGGDKNVTVDFVRIARIGGSGAGMPMDVLWWDNDGGSEFTIDVGADEALVVMWWTPDNTATEDDEPPMIAELDGLAMSDPDSLSTIRSQDGMAHSLDAVAPGSHTVKLVVDEHGGSMPSEGRMVVFHVPMAHFRPQYNGGG